MEDRLRTAETNIEVLMNNIFSKLFKKKLTEEIEGDDESIAEIGIETIEVLFDDKDNYSVTTIKKQNDKRPKTIMVYVTEEEFDATIIASYGSGPNESNELEGFIITKPDYEGETSREIKIGSTYTEVEKEYGKPSRILGGSQANYIFYEKTGIVFFIDSNNKVSTWMIYGKIK